MSSIERNIRLTIAGALGVATVLTGCAEQNSNRPTVTPAIATATPVRLGPPSPNTLKPTPEAKTTPMYIAGEVSFADPTSPQIGRDRYEFPSDFFNRTRTIDDFFPGNPDKFPYDFRLRVQILANRDIGQLGFVVSIGKLSDPIVEGQWGGLLDGVDFTKQNSLLIEWDNYNHLTSETFDGVQIPTLPPTAPTLPTTPVPVG